MKQAHIAIVALLALSSSACAMGGGDPTRAAGLTPAEIQAHAADLGATHTSHLVHSPAECAPDLADPVWGSGPTPVGFSCYSSAQGG